MQIELTKEEMKATKEFIHDYFLEIIRNDGKYEIDNFEWVANIVKTYDKFSRALEIKE